MMRFAIVLTLLTHAGAAAAQAQPNPNLAQVIQTIEDFNRPASCAVSLDGKHLFVANSGATMQGMPLGKGAISKLEIQPDGTLKMINAKFIEGLNAPLGIAVAPKKTKIFDAGALYVTTGNIDVCDDKGNRITNIKLCNPGVTMFDPNAGGKLGHIEMGPGSAVARSLGHTVLQPNGLCFDIDGNLFFADGGQMGANLVPAERGVPGIKRIRLEHIDAYANGRAEGNVTFVPLRSIPLGVYYSKADNAIYWSCAGAGAAPGSVWRIPRKDFPEANMVGNVFGDRKGLTGLCITPAGTLIVSCEDGALVYANSRRLDSVPFANPNLVFDQPADIKLHLLPNGNKILYVPEKEPAAAQEWNQRLRVVLMPGNM
jgi:hypothetical protein